MFTLIEVRFPRSVEGAYHAPLFLTQGAPRRLVLRVAFGGVAVAAVALPL
jgi:hypothetical protein